MLIRTGLNLLAGVTAVILLVVGSVLVMTSMERGNQSRNLLAAREILLDIARLRSLLMEIVLDQEREENQRWDKQIQHLQAATTRLVLENEKERLLAANYRDKFNTLSALYARLWMPQDRSGAAKNTADAETLRQLRVTLQDLAAETAELVRLKSEALQRMGARLELLIVSLATTMVLSILTLWILARRNILYPILKIQRGANIIAEGDLTHRLNFNIRNEIGELANRFDAMADALQNTQNRLKTEKSISQSAEKRVATIVEQSPYGILLVDTDGRIQVMNAAAENIFGYQRIELIGQSIERLVPSSDRDRHRQWRMGYQDHPVARQMRGSRLLHGLRKDGSLFNIEVTLAPMESDGRLGTLATVVDVSKRKRAKKQLDRHISELARSNRALNDFAYVASHDLKSPLHGIDQLAHWIAEDLGEGLDSNTQNYLRLMRSRINRLEALLDDLLAYSRVGRLGGDLAMVDTRVLVRDLFDLVSGDKQHCLILADDLPTLKTLRAPIDLVFRNLISNAIKHHDGAKATIEISCRPTDNGVEFSVKDDGPGVAPEHHERVFRLFQTLKPRDEIEGSGMGLALVRNAVETVGGTITLESDGQRGCIFRFTWPNEETLKEKLHD